ncbi:beta-sandwich domain-containing protein [Bdellovibrio bacteriovorus]|uniref:beta-sandwich domain-containing protein n=1 Tax=Bdellovibrio bacteriovorus TaxID=959 RepID=UPI0035A96477
MDRQWAQRILTSIFVLLAAGSVKAQSTYEGIGRVGEIARKVGGELYKLDLTKAVPLTQLRAKPEVGHVKLLSVTLVTEKKERIPVKALSNVIVANTDPALISENFSSDAAIITIEVKAEALWDKATLDINAISTKETPQLALRKPLLCDKKTDTLIKEKLDVIQVWAARAEGSPQGSIQEKYATQEFNRYVNEFLATLNGEKTSAISLDYTLALLNFFTERHNASRAGSAAEQAYKSMATGTFEVFYSLLQKESDQSCYVFSSEALINISLDFQKRYEANKPDSRARKIYEMMMSRIGRFIPSQYRLEIAEKNYSFRQADSEGHKYFKLFKGSKADSFLKTTYQEMSMNAYAIAEQGLIREAQQMDSDKRYELIVEYQAKYNDPVQYPQDIMLKYLNILSENGTLFRIHL